MYVITVDFRIMPAHRESFRRRVLMQARDSLEKERDCHQFDVCVDGNDPDRVFLYELYTDRAAFEQHLASAHFQAFDAEVAEWILEKSVTAMERLDG